MDPAAEKVMHVVDDDRQALIDLCVELGNLPDFAGHERPVADAVVAWLQTAGFKAFLQRISPDSANAVGVLAGSGDHAMDHEAVPGILLTSRALKKRAPRLQDLAAAILAEFGIDTPINPSIDLEPIDD